MKNIVEATMDIHGYVLERPIQDLPVKSFNEI